MALSPTTDDHYRPELRLTQRRADGQSHSTEELVESLERDIGEYRESVDALGTSLDRDKFRRELPALKENIERKIRSVENDLQTKKESGASGLILKRISDRLQHQVSKFNQLVSKEQQTQKMSTHNKREGDQTDLGDALYRADNNSSQSQQQQQRSAGGLAVREREAQELQGLERDILDLNDINKDMNFMVHEQGEDVSNIEQHTERAAGRVEKATKDTDTIRVYHWRNRKMMLIIAAVVTVAVICFILLIVIVVSIAVCSPPGGSC